MPKNYYYSPKTREFLHSKPAQRSRAGLPLPALHATQVPPPEVQDKQIAVWNGKSWDVVEDHRQKPDGRGGKKDGTPYWLPEDKPGAQPRYVEDLGPLPEGALLEEPQKSEEELLEEKFSSLRAIRDGKLNATDYLIMPDYPISADELAAVQEYRQALRDLPSQDGAPWDGGREETPWPEMPEVK